MKEAGRAGPPAGRGLGAALGPSRPLRSAVSGWMSGWRLKPLDPSKANLHGYIIPQCTP